ncbi:MAG TPA: aldo/keto reductase [bacterium]|jgi:aryl-alcohol dehydrogenase-like predicted oxidoreductase|nr:aldo/keto reductase [bacterium]
MKHRQIGHSALQVAPLALGGNVFGWTANEETSFKILDAFVDAGFNLIDTADTYSRWVPGHVGGESETVIGKWFQQSGKRNKVVIATKVGMDMGDGKKGLAKDYILKEVEDSLKRLQTDHIDLYQSHQDDPTTPLEETLEAYAQLVKQGKVRVIGASNYKVGRLDEAIEISKEKAFPVYQCLQPQYNLYDREDFEKNLEPYCLENRIGVIPYFSLAAGFLTGKYRNEADFSKSPRGGGMKKYFNDRGFRILKALDEVAADHETTPTSVALAWLIAQPSITAPIASATSVKQFEALAEGAKLILDEAFIEKLDEASAY